MRDNDALREHYQRRFRHVLVDEFQDTNRLQYAWLKMFAGAGAAGKRRVRGRRRRPEHLRVPRRAGRQHGRLRARVPRASSVIKLEQNYRSFGNILDAANELIAHNTKRLGKNLRTEAGPGEPVRVHEAPSDYAEAQWFVDEARQLHRDGIAAQRDRAALPQQRAEPRARERAVQCRHAVQGLRRPALLRARRGQARAGLPAPDREPERRHQLPARRQLPDARHRRAHASSSCRTRRAAAAAACTRASARVSGKGGAQPAAPSSR